MADSFGGGGILAGLGIELEVVGANKVKTDLDNVERSFKKTTDSIKGAKNETKRHGAESRKLSFAMLELSRGAEDFAVGFGINGMQGAIRGATNNISQMFSIMSPLAGTIAGFAAAGVASIAVMVGMASKSKKAAEGLDELTEALKRQNKVRLQAIGFGFQREDIAEARSVEGAGAEVQAKQRKLIFARGKQEGTEEQRAAKIQEFGKKALEFSFLEAVSETNQSVKTSEKRRDAFLDSILKQQGVETDLSKSGAFSEERTAAFEKREAGRKTVREDISISNIPAEFIENAVKAAARIDSEIATEFTKFVEKATTSVGIATKAVQGLEREVQILADDANKLAQDPKSKEAVKRREEQQKKDDKAAKEEESRLSKRRDLFSTLLNVFDPKQGKLFDINERFIARQKQIAGFDVPDAEKQRFGIAARQVAGIERQKVFADIQKKEQVAREKTERAREKEERARQKVEDDRKRNIDSARSLGLGFAKQFLPEDVSREIELQNRIRRIEDLEGVSPRIKGGLKELAGLTLDEAKQKQAPSFSGVTEFAKQFQLQISGRTDPVEKNTAEIVKVLKKTNSLLKNSELTVKNGP